LARADLRETYGRKWRTKTPRRERVMLRMGDLTPATEDTTPALPSNETPPAPPVDAKPRPRRQTATKANSRAKGQRTFEVLLSETRTLTALWPGTELTADRIRTAVHCSATNARSLRDALKSERAEGRSLHSVDAAEGEESGAEAA